MSGVPKSEWYIARWIRKSDFKFIEGKGYTENPPQCRVQDFI